MAIKPLTSEAIALTEKKMDMALDDIINMSKTTVNAKRQSLPNKSQKVLNNIAQDKSAKLQRFMNSRSSLRQGVLAQRRSNFQGNRFPLATEVARKAAVAPIQNGGFNHNRRVNWIKPRVGVPLAQRQNRIGSFAVKHQQQQQHHLHQQHHQQQQHQRQQQHHQQQQHQRQQQHHQQRQQQQQQQQRQLNMVARQKPQTLDSLFANMKEQRMRVFSQQNNAIRRGGVGPQRQQRGRSQFRN